jgi:uncharacterized FAD-dependent dehydrogenase
MALPHRVVVDLLEALETLDRVMPGVASGSTLLYAPEIKFYDTRYRVREGMETELPGFTWRAMLLGTPGASFSPR